MVQERVGQLSARIAGKEFSLDAGQVSRGLQRVLPEPLTDHFVVVGARRYPPKQVIALVTGLDRADFTTHQARRVLRRLGFTVGRRSSPPDPMNHVSFAGPHDGVEAALLRPFVGQWVAQSGMEILVAADSPEEVLSWLERHDQHADSMFRVPERPADATGAVPL